MQRSLDNPLVRSDYLQTIKLTSDVFSNADLICNVIHFIASNLNSITNSFWTITIDFGKQFHNLSIKTILWRLIKQNWIFLSEFWKNRLNKYSVGYLYLLLYLYMTRLGGHEILIVLLVQKYYFKTVGYTLYHNFWQYYINVTTTNRRPSH